MFNVSNQIGFALLGLCAIALAFAVVFGVITMIQGRSKPESELSRTYLNYKQDDQ